MGKRYPIVHVCDGPVTHEVSSFSTNTGAAFVPQDLVGLMDDKVWALSFSVSVLSDWLSYWAHTSGEMLVKLLEGS